MRVFYHWGVRFFTIKASTTILVKTVAEVFFAGDYTIRGLLFAPHLPLIKDHSFIINQQRSLIVVIVVTKFSFFPDAHPGVLSPGH